MSVSKLEKVSKKFWINEVIASMCEGGRRLFTLTPFNCLSSLVVIDLLLNPGTA